LSETELLLFKTGSGAPSSLLSKGYWDFSSEVKLPEREAV
jgi:hypothetical protein